MEEFIKKLFQCFFCRRDTDYATEEEIENAEAAIIFAFGGKNQEYGICESNAFLIERTNMLNKKYRIPIIAQSEIGDLLKNTPIKIIKKSRKKGKYLDSYEVAYQAIKICKKLGIKKVLVLAHPDHALRCKWTVEKLGLSTKTIDTTGCPYDPLSNQYWTRSAWKFIPREILARLMYLVQGKM